MSLILHLSPNKRNIFDYSHRSFFRHRANYQFSLKSSKFFFLVLRDSEMFSGISYVFISMRNMESILLPFMHMWRIM